MWKSLAIVACVVTLIAWGVIGSQLNRMTQAVERLNTVVDRLTQKMEAQHMADVNIVEGNSSIGRAQELTWQSGNQSIKLTVYPASTTETHEQFTARLVGFIQTYQTTYPPNAPGG